ncbi:unnamed protein product [Pleuronectes platessa]|uniref:Uncharacterized protein n=1 Tax=Pleuronectes platessa TaxID=8262 RepID=A0A9N7Z4N8_PLEPL|nr:unnamed protein product [Pleuronectes platessa]
MGFNLESSERITTLAQHPHGVMSPSHTNTHPFFVCFAAAVTENGGVTGAGSVCAMLLPRQCQEPTRPRSLTCPQQVTYTEVTARFKLNYFQGVEGPRKQIHV